MRTQFNAFLISLDRMPIRWEDRLTVCITSLVKKKITNHQELHQCNKTILHTEDIFLKDESYALSSLAKVCKLQNDIMLVRLPIKRGLLSILLDKIDDYYMERSQPYLAKLYKAMMATAYQGLLRISEFALGEHTIQIENVYVSDNRSRILIVLRSSKTHSTADRPQIIKINKLDQYPGTRTDARYSAFNLLYDYI